MRDPGRFGISVALTTAFTPQGDIDHDRLLRHASRVLEMGADGITLFGTTGEGASVGHDASIAAARSVIAGGIAPQKLTLGVAVTAVEDAVARVSAASALGIPRFLLPPPFYFKGVAEAAVFDWYAAVFAQIPAEAGIILYHIPQVTSVSVSPSLVRRLLEAFPDRIMAIKDSSGDWPNTEALLKQGGLMVLVGDERQLAHAARLGAAGAISGLANVVPDRLQNLAAGREDPALNDLIELMLTVPITPAVKVLTAELHDDPEWRRPLAPLRETPQEAREAILARFRALAVPTDA